jgi:hypothetical protein
MKIYFASWPTSDLWRISVWEHDQLDVTIDVYMSWLCVWKEINILSNIFCQSNNFSKVATDLITTCWGYNVSFIGVRNRSIRRKPLTCRKSLTNFITQCYIEYITPHMKRNNSCLGIGTLIKNGVVKLVWLFQVIAVILGIIKFHKLGNPNI